MDKIEPALLVKAIRDGLVEREHFGFILCLDSNKKIIYQKGNFNNYACYLRSCAKPFQALPLILSGAYDYFNFNLSELAVCCASHTGSLIHTEIIKNILIKSGKNENDLKCGIHPPLNKETQIDLIEKKLPFTAIHNNCSGKHAGMITVCVKEGWDTENYLDKNHPLQKWIKEITKEYCGINEANYYETLDGCGTPVGGMFLQNMAEGFLNLLKTKEGQFIINAFLQNPFLIGGEERIDSIIINSSNGNLFAKVGAEGLCVVLNKKTKQCLLVKIMDANMQARSIVLLETLIRLNWLNKELLNDPIIKNICNPELKTLSGYKTGEVKAVF